MEKDNDITAHLITYIRSMTNKTEGLSVLFIQKIWKWHNHDIQSDWISLFIIIESS